MRRLRKRSSRAKGNTAYTGQLVNSYQLVQSAIEEVEQRLTCYAQAKGRTAANNRGHRLRRRGVRWIVGGRCRREQLRPPRETTARARTYALGDDKRYRNFKTDVRAHCPGQRRRQRPDNRGRQQTPGCCRSSRGGGASHTRLSGSGDRKLIEVYLRLISNKSIIPLLQGILRYHYYFLSDEESGTGTFSTLDKFVGEGGAFAFGALPKLWAFSSRGAKKAEEEQTKISGDNNIAGCTSAVRYQDLRLSFECNYGCLVGITCAPRLSGPSTTNNGDASSSKSGATTTACDDDEANGSDEDVRLRQAERAAQGAQCKLFTGKPGIKGRDKNRFTF